jgi:hypothetical protein
MRRHAAKPLLPLFVHDPSERVEAADERPVAMHSAAFFGKENAARVGFDAQDQSSGFGAGAVELCRRKTEVSGKAQGFVRRDSDSLVAAAGATHLALE